MEPTRFQLEGPNLADLKTRVLAEHGTEARIVAAERVTVGGIRGFFARQHYEVTVEIGPNPDERRRGAHSRLDLPTRLGIAALLEEVDDAEARIHARPRTEAMSTSSPDFATLMDELTFSAGLPPVASPREREHGDGPEHGDDREFDFGTVESASSLPPLAAPHPLSGAGDLIVLIGLHDDPVTLAQSMLPAVGSAEIRVAGALEGPGLEPTWDRRSVLASRAAGVARGHSLLVAFGLGSGVGDDVRARAKAIATIGADQIWGVVDAGRKADDTLNWVRAMQAYVHIDALAVVGSASTNSPGTVNEIGIPIGWEDDQATTQHDGFPASRRLG